ncbi:MAG TPA: hypothetical protein VF530_21120 [Planctomycetota bacterium]
MTSLRWSAARAATLLCCLASTTSAQEIVPTDEPDTDADFWSQLRESLPFDIGGGFLLWYYSPFLDGAEDNTEIYYANLVFDARYEDFGIHFEPRFRDSKLRPFFQSNVWIQELYMSWNPEEDSNGVLKVGKVYSQFGRFWDGVFYGNIPYFDGLKLDPDLGLSWENKLEVREGLTVEYSAQFFDRDGATNGSLQGRDTLSVGNDQSSATDDTQRSFERNVLVGRIAPTLALGDATSITVGVSGMHGEADFAAPASDSKFTRANGELSVTTGPFTVFGDYTHQNGNHVIDFPLPGSDSDDIDYLMSGASWTRGDWTLRYNYSFGDYDEDALKEELHMPGLVWQFDEHLSLWFEYVYWTRDDAGDPELLDRSMNVVLYGAF